MKHVALYRKWRPQTFGDLVGQTHISRTLKNAMAQDRLAHAYLFCGPRGTGKTSSARLLAKALNCENPQDTEPCNQCHNCIEITEGHSLDVIEIDAASNRGIDDARDLREQVRFSATGGKYRVFIIDEFHMLTTEAFNALLKTLEEPPDQVIFVLATTEPHKVLQTIISRCQRFDFQRIGLADMTAHLQKVAQAEDIQVSPQALESIARKAAGGLRDAMSLLDQVHALARPGETLDDSLVYQTLGLIQEDILFALLSHLFERRIEDMLQITQELLSQGYDAHLILQDLVHLLRHLLLAHLPEDKMEALGVPAHLTSQAKTLYESQSQAKIIQLIESLSHTFDRLQRVTQPDTWLEVELCRQCFTQENHLLVRLEALETQIKNGEFTLKSTPAVAQSASVTTQTQAPPPPTQAPSAPELQSREVPSNSQPPAAQPTSAAPPAADPARPDTQAEPAPPQAPQAPPAQAAPTPSGPPQVTSAADCQALWQHFMQEIASHQTLRPQYGFVANGHLAHIDADRKIWRVVFRSKAHRNQVEKTYRAGRLQELIERIAGPGYTLSLEMPNSKNPLPKAPPKPLNETLSASAPSITPKPTAPPSSPPTASPPSEVMGIPELPDEEPEPAPVSLEPVSPAPVAPAAPPAEPVPPPQTDPVSVSAPAPSKGSDLNQVAALFKGKVVNLKGS